MRCCSTHNCHLVVDGGKWIEVKVDMRSTEATKRVTNQQSESSAQTLDWQPLLATTLSNVVLIWCINNSTWPYSSVSKFLSMDSPRVNKSDSPIVLGLELGLEL